MNKIARVLCAGLLVAATMSVEAEAGKKSRNIAKGIIIGAGIAAVLGAAATAAQADEDRVVYTYRDTHSRRDNAIAACLHQANRVMQRNGYDGVELRRVRSADRTGSGNFRVQLSLLSYEDGYAEPVRASCRVSRNRVTRIAIQ
jgi:hypothetical protein